MSETLTDSAPTSTATTRGTEPEVVAAISSAEGNEDQFAFRADSVMSWLSRPVVVVAAGIVLGYGAYRWLNSSR